MKAKELKEKLDMYIENQHGDDEVVVRLSEPSVAVTASEPVQCIGPGIDWDSGKLFIHTDKPLIHRYNQRDIPKMARKMPSSDGKKSPVFHCPACASKIKKGMTYCPACGQKVCWNVIGEKPV